jgi:hypothetical protein
MGDCLSCGTKKPIHPKICEIRQTIRHQRNCREILLPLKTLHRRILREILRRLTNLHHRHRKCVVRKQQK